jgi:hypothetical protein
MLAIEYRFADDRIGLQIQVVRASTSHEIDSAFATLRRNGPTLY